MRFLHRAALAAVCLCPALTFSGCNKAASTAKADPSASTGDATQAADATKKPQDAAAAATTRTNLQAALDAEAAGTARYQAFAAKADQEGLKQASRLFRGAATSETILTTLLTGALGPNVTHTAAASTAPVVKTTAENLKAALEDDTLISERDYARYLQQTESGAASPMSTAIGRAHV